MTSIQPTPEEIRTFRDIVESKLGLYLQDNSPKSLREILNKQRQRRGTVTASYLAISPRTRESFASWLRV